MRPSTPRRPAAPRARRPSAAAALAVAVLLGTAACSADAAAPSPDPAPAAERAPTTGTSTSPTPTAEATSAAPDAPLPGTETGPPPEVAVGAVPTTSDGDHAGVPVGTAVLYAIPDLPSVPGVLPDGYASTFDLGQYRLEPTVPGQACSSRPSFTIAGRQWSWGSRQGKGQESVGVVITGWREGRGSAAFDDVVQDAGHCRFPGQLTPASVEVPGADQVWAATSTSPTGYESTNGAARVGDQVIGVEVTGTGDAPLALAASVLTAATADLVAAGPPTPGVS